MVLLDAPPPTVAPSDSRRTEGRSNQRRSSQHHSQRLMELPHSRSHRSHIQQEPAPPRHRERSRRESTLAVYNDRRSRHDSFRTPTQRQLEPEPSHGGSRPRRNATVSYRRSGLPLVSEQPNRGSAREEVSVLEKAVVGIKRFINHIQDESSRRDGYAEGLPRRETGRSSVLPSRSNNPFSRDSRKGSSDEPSRGSRSPSSRRDRRSSFVYDGPGEDWELVEEVWWYRDRGRRATEK